MISNMTRHRSLLRLAASFLLAASLSISGCGIQSIPQAENDLEASAAEVFFTLTTDRSYWLDSLLQLEAKVGQGAGPAWSYQVTWRTPVDGGRTFSPHSLDLPFVFDNVAVAADQVGEPTPGTTAMADTMSATWLAFARTGDPNHAGIPHWPAYNLDRRATLHLDVPPTVVDDPHAAERLAMSRYPTRQAT